VDLQRALASQTRPDPRVALPIVMQVLAGLGLAHEHGVVHRDVKPSNVFLPRGRPVKVMDFGVARMAGGTTAAGVVVGTPNYMSPEQVRTGLVDGRSDLFSVGLILYELVTGEKAYRADNVVSLLYKIAHEEPPLHALPAGAEWERLRQVVARALARDPEQRYPDARAMAAHLGRALQDLGGTLHPVSTADHTALIPEPQPPPPPTAALPARVAHEPAAESSRPFAWALLAVAATALVGGLGLFLYLRAPAELASPPAVAVPEPAPSAATEAPAPAPSAPPDSPTPAPAAVSPSSVSPSPISPATGSPEVLPATPGRIEEAAEDETRPGGDAARLERANDLFDRGRYAAALAEARAVLRRNPGNAEARSLVEDAEVAIVVEDRIKKARDALRKGDQDRALQEIRAGLAVAPSDARLLTLFKEATR
jgi:serine/threonine-protein kinase